MPADCNVILREDKSFVYDLDVQRGIVSSRVALLLRSAEIKPLLSDLFLFPNSLLLTGVKQLVGGGDTFLCLAVHSERVSDGECWQKKLYVVGVSTDGDF